VLREALLKRIAARARLHEARPHCVAPLASSDSLSVLREALLQRIAALTKREARPRCVARLAQGGRRGC